MVVDCAIYRGGRRDPGPAGLAAAAAAARAGDAMVWLALERPTAEEFADLTDHFDLHELAAEDAVHAAQRPKLERYGDALYCVLRPARYDDAGESVAFGEVHVFTGPGFVVTVCHDDVADLAEVRAGLEGRPDLVRRGPVAVLHAIADHVVDGYAPVVAGLENDVEEIEDEVFEGRANVSRRIYGLTRQVIAFQRATRPLPEMLSDLMAHVGEEEHRYLRDVQDHAIRVQEHVDGSRQLLQNILQVNLTVETKALSEVAIAQNEQVKRISAWAAILFAPTLVGTVYGMNFRHMPELRWQLGYPFALGVMVLISAGLFAAFKRRGWI